MKRLIFALLLFFPAVSQAAPTVGDCADGRPYDPCVIYVGPVGAGECDGGYNGGDCDYQDYLTADGINDTNISATGGAYNVEFRMYDYVETTYVLVDGWTTDSTYGITIKGAASDRTATNTGIYSDERYRLEMNTGSYGTNAMQAREINVTFENLQCKITAPGALGCMGDNNAMGADDRHYYLGNVLVMDLNDAISNGMCPIHYKEATEFGQHIVVANNIMYTLNTSVGYSGPCVWNESGRKAYVYNNTCYGAFYDTALRTSGTQTNTNNIVVQNHPSDPCFSNNTTAADNNTCNLDETDPGSNNKMNQTPTFANAGSYDFHLSPSDTVALGAGADLSSATGYNVTTDIDGDSRSVTYDIGADETAGAAAARRILMTEWLK